MTTIAPPQNREAVVEALLSLVATAKRCPYIVARFAADQPTAWDRRHEDIDALITMLDPGTDALVHD
jgi:hypothetical protein